MASTSKPRIYADANSCTVDGKFRLSIQGALADLERFQSVLAPGLEITLNVQDEFELDAILERDALNGGWLAEADWESRKDI